MFVSKHIWKVLFRVSNSFWKTFVYFSLFRHASPVPINRNESNDRFENQYDPVAVRDVMVENPWIPVVAVTFYGVAIYFGRRYFEHREPFNWRYSMAFWNLGLSIFSAIGFVRTLPQVAHNILNYTATENLCLDPESHFGSGATGFWVQLFCLSKFPYVLSRWLCNAVVD